MNLQKFKDELSVMATGMTKAQAIEQGVCSNCKKPPTFYSEMGKKEYFISGTCEPCFDLIMTDPEDACAICELPVEHHTHGLIGISHDFEPKEVDDADTLL